jgi:hypothetical protein
MRVSRHGQVLNVEHKLFAPQGLQQLPRYLGLPKVDAGFVAFVSADFRTVSAKVVTNARYVRPSSRQDHFVWADLYSLIEKSAKRTPFAAATLTLMKSMDLAPVHPIIGDVREPKNDLRLRELWNPLVQALRKSDWTVNSSFGKDRKSELWIEDGPSQSLDVVRLDPFSSPTSLVVRLKASSKRHRDQMLLRLEKNVSSIPGGSSLGAVPLRLTPQRFAWAIDVKVGWLPLLRRCSKNNVALTQKTLRRYVQAVMLAAACDAV